MPACILNLPSAHSPIIGTHYRMWFLCECASDASAATATRTSLLPTIFTKYIQLKSLYDAHEAIWAEQPHTHTIGIFSNYELGDRLIIKWMEKRGNMMKKEKKEKKNAHFATTPATTRENFFFFFQFRVNGICLCVNSIAHSTVCAARKSLHSAA